jgi:hypothetical protein
MNTNLQVLHHGQLLYVSNLPLLSYLAEHCNQLPIVWEAFLPEAQVDYLTEQKKYDKAICTYHKELSSWNKQQSQVNSAAQVSLQSFHPTNTCKGKKTAYDTKHTKPVPLQPHMQAEEVPMFLALATALKLYLSWELTDNSISQVLSLLYDYLLVYWCVSDQFLIYVLSVTLSSYTVNKTWNQTTTVTQKTWPMFGTFDLWPL